MKIRLCDKCKKTIPSKEEFYKVMKTFWTGENKHSLEQKHIADLCKKCWEKIK